MISILGNQTLQKISMEITYGAEALSAESLLLKVKSKIWRTRVNWKKLSVFSLSYFCLAVRDTGRHFFLQEIVVLAEHKRAADIFADVDPDLRSASS